MIDAQLQSTNSVMIDAQLQSTNSVMIDAQLQSTNSVLPKLFVYKTLSHYFKKMERYLTKNTLKMSLCNKYTLNGIDASVSWVSVSSGS